MKNTINNLRIWKNIFVFNREWRRIKNSIPSSNGNVRRQRRVAIVTCDPWSFSGSKGDEAMIQAIMDQLRGVVPTIEFGTITATEKASHAAESMGITPYQVWDNGLTAIVNSIKTYNPCAVIIIGADCMDGYYSPYTTIRLLAIGDIAARIGYQTTITGFSFNSNPIKQLRNAFNSTSQKLKINLRDPISFRRFQKFCKAKSELVTDAAFMLNPSESSMNVDSARIWSKNKKAEGYTLLGFNIHPMLIKNASESQINEFITAATKTLDKALSVKSNLLACALISHDYRGNDGDDRCLREIYDNLKQNYSDRLLYTTAKLTAGELKATAGLMDMIITGRMHLAIAALGMGIPVAVITYQDKFQGLLEHFSFSDDLHISPDAIVRPEGLDQLLEHLMKNRIDLKNSIKKQLPKIMELSRRNISNITLDEM